MFRYRYQIRRFLDLLKLTGLIVVGIIAVALVLSLFVAAVALALDWISYLINGPCSCLVPPTSRFKP